MKNKTDDTTPQSKTAPVSGFARSFISGKPIDDAMITILEDDTAQFKTNKHGCFGPIEWPIEKPITLVLQKPGYRTTQTATINIPSHGINNPNPLYNISFQVLSNFAFTLFSYSMRMTEDKNACQVATTITPPKTTLDNIPQGEPNVEVTLSPDPNVKPFYFDMFPFIHKTNPFRGLKSTSLDGGVVFANIPEGKYTLRAKKEDILFTEVTIIARKGVLVNASPPFGLTVLEYRNVGAAKKSHHFNFFKPAIILGAGALGLATCGIGGALAGLATGYLGSSTIETLTERCSKRNVK